MIPCATCVSDLGSRRLRAARSLRSPCAPAGLDARNTVARSSSLRASQRRREVATPERRYGGITLGGIIVIVGVLLIFIWSFWIGLVIALVGLVGFGGFARGKWY
jgi:hypothetical protein